MRGGVLYTRGEPVCIEYNIAIPMVQIFEFLFVQRFSARLSCSHSLRFHRMNRMVASSVRVSPRLRQLRCGSTVPGLMQSKQYVVQVMMSKCEKKRRKEGRVCVL